MRRLPPALAVAGVLLIITVAVVTLLRDGGEPADLEARAGPEELVRSEVEAPATEHLPLTVVRLPAPALLFSSALASADGEAAAQYAVARAAFDAGDRERAAALFERIAEGNGILAPMATFRQAQALAATDRREQAADRFAAVIEGGRLPAALHFVALTEAARNFERLDRPRDALALLADASSVPGTTATQRAEARWASARIRREMGDERWSADAIAVLETAPASMVAREALDAIDDAGIDAPIMTRALVNYRARRNDTARELYRAVVSDSAFSAAERATAWFYLGAIEERRNEPEAALEAYARALELAPAGALAADALYWRGRVLEELGRPLDAAREYDRLLEGFPGSNFAADARLRAAVGLGLAGEHVNALGRLERIAAGTSGASAAAAARWHTVFRESFGANATVALDPRDHHPASLWSLLDASTQRPLPANGDLDAFAAARPPSAEEVAEIRAWLTGRHGSPDRSISYVQTSGPAELGLALAAIGEQAVGRALLQQLVWDSSRTPHELLDLSIAAHHAGLHDVSLRAAMRLVSPLSTVERMEAPRALLRLAYPAPFHDELTAAIERSPVSPLLLLALVRQESAFNPDAVSHANAIGLAQVIPTTGQDIARALGEPWGVERLRDPATSLRFGAYYLHTQLRNFDGDVLAALGAYNAGGGSVQRWRRDQLFDGPDGFIHTVDFAETRLYFEHVLENYAWYRFVYGASETPSIR